MSSGGGGCRQCGSGPARRRFCNKGPAFITASKNFPFSGNAWTGKFNCCSNDHGGGVNRTAVSVTGDETILSSQSEEEKATLVMGSSSMLETTECGGGVVRRDSVNSSVLCFNQNPEKYIQI